MDTSVAYAYTDAPLHHVTSSRRGRKCTRGGNVGATKVGNKTKTTDAAAMSKIDPSFKSKRYRDKLRTEIKALECLLPVDRTSVHRKLDSQTVFRLSIGFFRMKLFLQAAGIPSFPPIVPPTTENKTRDKLPVSTVPRDHDVTTSSPTDAVVWDDSESMLQALDGYMLAVTSDGTILYVSESILQHLGFNQVDLVMRCMYGIVHPDDHQELKVILEQTLNLRLPGHCGQGRLCCTRPAESDDTATCRTVSFLCRMKCFNGTTTGYLKMTCTGHMRWFPYVTKSQRTSNQVLFAFCRPFLSVSTDPAVSNRSNGFWTKHDLDLKFKQMEDKITNVTGHESSELEGTSVYSLLHPEDLTVFRNCHKALIQSEEIQTMYFRLQHKDGSWVWVHTRGKVVFKNGKKCSIIFTHCPVKEEDSTYIQQEAILRQQHSLTELMYGRTPDTIPRTPSSTATGVYSTPTPQGDDSTSMSGGLGLHDPHGQCPSSWHTAADRHSPVFPQHHLPHQAAQKRQLDENVQARSTQAQAYYSNPLSSWWNHRTQNAATSDKPAVDYWTQGLHSQHHYNNPYHYNAMRKEYFMHFNGVGFAAHDVTAYKPPASTLYIQGHVTAYESEVARYETGSNGVDSYYGPYSHLGNRENCAYNCVQYKTMHPSYETFAENDSHHSWEMLRRAQTGEPAPENCSIVKEEHTPHYHSNHHGSASHVYEKTQHPYSELISASDFPTYPVTHHPTHMECDTRNTSGYHQSA